MKTHTNNFKEQIKKFGRQIDSRITFGSTVLGKNDLNAVTPSYQGAILKSVMKQLDIDSNVEIPIGTILKYEFGLKVNGEYEYINYGNYVVYSIEKQENTNSYKIVCYDKLLYSMLNYVKLPITYPISIRDYINTISTALGLKFANKSGTFANYNKQIQADLYDGLGYTFRDVLDELAQVTASTICLNENDELEIRYITETNDVIDEEYLKDVNVNFGEKFGAVNTIVLSRSGDSDSVYYPEVLPANPYEIKISDNQIMNGNDRADFLPDIYNKLNGLEFYTNDFVSTGILYYDLCDRYSVKVGDNTYSCVMFNDEVLVTQGLEENIYTELPEQTETDYKHASKDDRMINQAYLIVKKNEAEILAVINTTQQLQKEINPTKDESGSEIIIEDASNNSLTYLEIEGKSTQKSTDGKNLLPKDNISNKYVSVNDDGTYNIIAGTPTSTIYATGKNFELSAGTYTFSSTELMQESVQIYLYNATDNNYDIQLNYYLDKVTFTLTDKKTMAIMYLLLPNRTVVNQNNIGLQIELGEVKTDWEEYGQMPSPQTPSEIKSVGTYNAETGKYGIEVEIVGKNLFDGIYEKGYINVSTGVNTGSAHMRTKNYVSVLGNTTYTFSGEVSAVRYGLYYNEQGNYIGYIMITDNSNIGTFTTLENVRYLRWYVINQQNLNEKTQLEKSSVGTDYVPYEKKLLSMVLNVPLRSLPNGVKDIAYIKNNKLYVDRKIGSVVLDGDETILTYKYNGTNGIQINNILAEKLVRAIGMSNRTSKIGQYYTSNSIWCGVDSKHIYWIGILDELGLSTADEFKTWLLTNNTQIDYELATPITEELGEIEMLKTLKGYNNISTTDKLLPIINLTYVRDTIIADYVENHVTELKLTENEIKASVESVSSSVDGLNTTINRVEEITNDNSQVINVISTNIDRTSGEVREVTTTTGFTFNKDGMAIDDGSGFKAEHRANGTYYKDGNSIVGQYTKDGSKQKDLELFGTYSYGKESIDDTPMFIGQLYRDENNEQCFGHFYNGGD